MSSPLERALALVPDGPGDRIPQSDGSVLVRCPGPNHARGDENPSLHLSEGEDGRLLVCCQSGGCDLEDILEVWGWSKRDLFPKKKDSRVVKRYDYTDENDNLLFQVERLQPKRFRQRRPDPTESGRWIYDLKGVRRVLYRLPELIEARKTGDLIWVTEGEKDADALAALGLTATTCPMGAGKWRTEYSESLAGARVLVLPDNDPAGRRHARAVAKSLHSVAAEVKVVELPVPPKADVYDWLENDGSVEALVQLAEEAPLFSPSDVLKEIGLLLSDIEPEQVSWLWAARIPLGKLTILDGDPGLGKSTLSLDIAARVTTGREMPDGPRVPLEPAGVVILTAEDGLADTVRPRFDAAEGDPERMLAVLLVPAKDSEERLLTLPGDLYHLKQAVERVGATLVIVDPLVAFLDADTDTHRDQSVRALLFELSKFAEETGVAMLVIRHLNKSTFGNPLYRGGGSIGFIAAARSGLLVAKDLVDPSRRVLAPTKCNLAEEPGSLSFHLESAENGVPRLVWDGASELDAKTLLLDAVKKEGSSERDFAKEVVALALSDGPMRLKDLRRITQEEGLSESMTRKALDDLGCEPYPDGHQGRWHWRLPVYPDFEDSDDH